MPLFGLSCASATDLDKDGTDDDEDVVDDGDDGDVIITSLVMAMRVMMMKMLLMIVMTVMMVMQANNLGGQEERFLVLQDPHRPFQPDQVTIISTKKI